jgi:hypothetical protein
MSTTEQRLAANRINAVSSTGPVTQEGKLAASRNSTRHGLLSTRLFLDDENPAEFEDLLHSLVRSLNPVGAIEAILVERIAVTIWRQRRLIRSETASLDLARRTRWLAGPVSAELGRGFGSELKPDELLGFDPERETWCRKVLDEMDVLETVGALDPASVEQHAPLSFEQLTTDAAESPNIAAFLSAHDRGLTGYLADLLLWCREQLREAAQRPLALGLAEQVRAKRLVLPADALELLSRYQTTLDTQLYKGLRALREAQEWRLKTLDASKTGSTHDADIEQAA